VTVRVTYLLPSDTVHPSEVESTGDLLQIIINIFKIIQ
jgi:hypothetical protein